MREPNQIFDSKVRIRENDIKAVAARRVLAKTRLAKAEVESVDNNKTWYELAAANSSSNKSQNIFPGLSLKEGEIKTGLETILKQTGKDVAVANFVEDGKHKIILAKKNAKGLVEYIAVANDGNKDAEIERLTKGTTSSVMIYAGENLEFVVGGDYGPLSILAEGDRQNIFIKREEDLNIDLFKQMFGRDRGGVENISRKVTLIGEVAKGKAAEELADKSFANSQEKDLSTILQFLQTKLKKYYKTDAASKEKFATTSANILENGDEKDLASLIADRRTLTNQVTHQSGFLKDGVDQEKFRRDLKAFAFYSLAARSVNKGTDLRKAFAEISFEGFTVSKELKSLMETSGEVSVLDNLESFSELLHLKKEVKPEIKSEKLAKLKRQALAPKRASLLEVAENIQSLIETYAQQNPEIIDNPQDYKVSDPNLVSVARNKDGKVDGFIFDHGEKEGQISYKFAQDGIYLSGEKEPLILEKAKEVSAALEKSLVKMRDISDKRKYKAMQAIAESARGLQSNLNEIANSELQENLGGRFVIQSREDGNKKVVTAFTVGVDKDFKHKKNEGEYKFSFDDTSGQVVGLLKKENDSFVFVSVDEIKSLQSALDIVKGIAKTAVEEKQKEIDRIKVEKEAQELVEKLREDQERKILAEKLEKEEKLKAQEIVHKGQAANELRDILETAFDLNEYQNSGLNIDKARDQKNVTSFSIKKGEEVLKYEFIFHPTETKVIGLMKSNEEQNSQEIKAIQEIVKAELERVREVKRLTEEQQARELAENSEMLGEETKTRELEAQRKADEIERLRVQELENQQKTELEQQAKTKLLEEAKLKELADAEAEKLTSKSIDLRIIFKAIDESLLEFSGISDVVKSEKGVQSFSLTQGDEKLDYQFILSGEPLKVTGVKKGEIELSADEIEKLAAEIKAEITKANAKKLEADEKAAANTAGIIANQALTTFNSLMQELIDKEAAKRREQEKLKSEKVEPAKSEVVIDEEQKVNPESEAAQSILAMLKKNVHSNKYLSSKYDSKLIDVDVSQRGFFSEEYPMSFTIVDEEAFAGKYEFKTDRGIIVSLSKNNQVQTLEEIKKVEEFIVGQISKAAAVEKAKYEEVKKVRDSGTDKLSLEEVKVLLEHEVAAMQKSHQPLTDSEIASKVELIAKNDLHNLKESAKLEKDRKTEFFNSDKVMRTLAKVHAISELQGGKIDLEEWKKVWGPDKSLNLDLTRADKAILAMLGMNDAGVMEVFGSIEKPKLVLDAIDDIKLENIMNVASKLITAIGPEELKKYSGKEVEASNGIKKIISDKLEKGVAGRSLSFSLQEEKELEVAPQTSVEKPQAWKVSLIDKSHVLVVA